MSKKKKSKKKVIYVSPSPEYLEMKNRIEPLRKDLESYLQFVKDSDSSDSCDTYIRHPYCNEQIFDVERCALIHETIDERTAKGDACFEAHNYEGFVMGAESSERVNDFETAAERI